MHHAVLQHDPRTQRVLHPFPSLVSPHGAQRPPTPLHAIRQHANRLPLPTRHRSYLPLRIQQHRLSLRSNAPQRAHRMLGGVLSQEWRYAFL
jgi:hypothetical protein